MADKILTFNGKTISGPSGTGTVIIDIPVLPEPAANTLRFDFGDKSYDPTVAGVGSSGTWTKLSHPFNNIWDWTNTNTSWATAFGNTMNPGAFADYENNPVKVIAAGDTSSVTDFSRFFAWCTAITEICPIDTSNATNVRLLFNHCENCEKFPSYLDFRRIIDCLAIFQGCHRLTTAPDIDFPIDHSYSVQNLFNNCWSLTEVPLYDLSMCNSLAQMFYSCINLETVPLFNTSNVTLFASMFYDCRKLRDVPLFDTNNGTDFRQMFRMCESLTEVPLFNTISATNMMCMFDGVDYGDGHGDAEMHIRSIPNFNYSQVSRFDNFMRNNVDITEITEMNIEANVTRCDNMFKNCPNVKSGQKELYDKLSVIGTITNHADCFKDCGSNTAEGRAELAQIPVSWGGTMADVGE